MQLRNIKKNISIKKYLPHNIKLIPWFLFKSPQRKLGFYVTYRTDISGLLSFIFKNLAGLFSKHQLQPISICTGLKNRSENYLNYVLDSILKMDHQELIEISIFDCNSNDIQNLEEKIRRKWKGKLVFTSENCEFSRAYTFNKAITQAANELIFAADADMSLPKDLVAQTNKFVSKKSVWFPVCFDLKKNKPPIISEENGYWRNKGKGMFAAYKWQFIKIGKYDEKFKTWGGEDDDLWQRFYLNNFLPIRNNCKGLFHNYHPGVEKIKN